MKFENMNKYKKLFLSVVFDLIGWLSFIIPGLGEVLDIAWAPASAFIMTKMYKGNTGRLGAVVSFVEEAMPGLDIIPTFTLMWIYVHIIKGSNEDVKKKLEGASSD